MKLSLRRRHAQMVGDVASSHKIDWVNKSLDIRNLERPYCFKSCDNFAECLGLTDWLSWGAGERSAPEACAADLFLTKIHYSIHILLFQYIRI